MNDLDALRKAAWDARDALSAAEAVERDRRNSALVGRCFTAQNCYSCPDGPSDYWPMFCKVLAAEEGGIKVFEFQRDKHGKCEIETSVFRSSLFTSVEISPADFAREWAAFLTKMTQEAEAALGT
jgi:hypothetical protein